GSRAPCGGGSATNVCTTGRCDGVSRTSCDALAGGETVCHAASCSGGISNTTGTCDEKGGGRGGTSSSCSHYTCQGTACGSKCTSDADCAPMFHCDPRGACIANVAASCDGMHSLVAPDGAQTDCAPYGCSGATCLTSCSSIKDCAYPAECSP